MYEEAKAEWYGALMRRAKARFNGLGGGWKQAESVVKAGPGARVGRAPKRESGSRGDAS